MTTKKKIEHHRNLENFLFEINGRNKNSKRKTRREKKF